MNGLKNTIRSGKVTLGTWVTIGHPEISDILSTLPFDWLVFDMEHGPLDIGVVEILMMPLKGTNITPIVRIPWNDLVVIKRVLDIGAYGLVIPWVNSRSDVENALIACKYPPHGLRGVGPRRCIMYGAYDIKKYYETFENELIIAIQAETRKALDNLEEIASVNGVDIVFIGPNDLSASLGIFREFNHPKFLEALSIVIKTCRKTDTTPGIMAYNLNQARKYIEMGFKFISIANDAVMMRNIFNEILTSLKASS
ncbi:MAG: aldolase/citrate lyase family protein [Candidatus Methanomethylicia archaeon]